MHLFSIHPFLHHSITGNLQQQGVHELLYQGISSSCGLGRWICPTLKRESKWKSRLCSCFIITAEVLRSVSVEAQRGQRRKLCLHWITVVEMSSWMRGCSQNWYHSRQRNKGIKHKPELKWWLTYNCHPYWISGYMTHAHMKCRVGGLIDTRYIHFTHFLEHLEGFNMSVGR